MHKPTVKGLDGEQFEWVCGGIIGAVASSLNYTTVGAPMIMAPNYDGGLDSKIGTTTGVLGIQSKAYGRFEPGPGGQEKSFENEAKAITGSFMTFLANAAHNGVTAYVWCSTHSRTVKNEATADAALAEMRLLATGAQRSITFTVRFAEDLDEIIRAHRPEYFAVMAGYQPLDPDEIQRVTMSAAESILARLGDAETPSLQFPAARTERLLDTLVDVQVTGTVDLREMLAHAENVQQRGRALLTYEGDDSRELDHSSEAARLVTQISALASHAQTDLGGALVALKELKESVTAAVTRRRDEAVALSEKLRSAADRRTEFSDQMRFEKLVAYWKGLLALAPSLDDAQCVVESALSRQLLITGRWGTGKSYQVAQHARREMERKRPVLLLRAREFVTASAPILEQPWRGLISNSGASGDEFLVMLDDVGRKAGAPLTIIIDGLNESALRDPEGALRRLTYLLDRLSFVRLIVTERRDEGASPSDFLPTFRHTSPDKAVLSAALQAALGARPGTHWHAALTNPLLAAVAARVVSARPQSEDRAVVAPGRVGLLNGWIDLLVDEASDSLGIAPMTVRRFIKRISLHGNGTSIEAAARDARLSVETADVLAHRFVQEGLLETSAQDEDLVGFRWQGARDMVAAEVELSDANPRRGAARLIREAGEDQRWTMLDTIADVLPTVNPPREILDVRIPTVTSEERIDAFALSLERRSSDQVTDRTVRHATRILRRGGERSEWLVWAALAAPLRAQLGASWLASQLRESSLSEREKFWPDAIKRLVNGSSDSQQSTNELLTWYVDRLFPDLRGTDAADVVELLAWFGCAARATGLPAYAISSIAEITRLTPDALPRAWNHLKDVDDDHVRDALLAAASGVVTRWPLSDAAQCARSLLAQAAAEGQLRSFRSVAAAHGLDGGSVPLHEFLRLSLPALPRPGWRAAPVQIPDEDRAMFADGRSSQQAQLFERQVWRSMTPHHGTAVRRWKSEHQPLDDDILDDSHIGSLLLGRWLAHQYAEYPTGHRLWLAHHGYAKAGTPENSETSRLLDAASAWDFWADPTMPVECIVHHSDRVRPEAWWVPETQQFNAIATDPDGVEWIVLEGGFRVLEPNTEASSNGRSLTLGTSNWWNSEDDGAPRPGLVRHEYVRVGEAQLVGAPSGSEGQSRRGSRRFADRFASRGRGGELVHSHIDGTRMSAPTLTLLELVDASWSGNALDCLDVHGALVVTDPSAGTGLPPALLVRRDAFEGALRQKGLRAQVRCNVNDMRSSMRADRSRASIVTIP